MSTSPVLDRLLMGSPLRRRGVCVVIVAILGFILAFASIVQIGVFAGMRADVMMVFLSALVLSTALSVVPVSVLWFLDRRERESPWLFAAAFLWGGCIATALALPFNTIFFQIVGIWVAQNPMVTEILGPEAATLLAAPISAPLIEEITKALGVLLLFWLLRPEFDNMRDGIVYGALIGAGFNWFEAALYVAQGYVQYGEAPFAVQLGARYALFGLGGHAMFTSIFGAMLGLAIQTRYLVVRLLAPIIGLLLAIIAHAINNVLPLFAVLVQAAVENPPTPAQREVITETGFVHAFLFASVVQLVIYLPFLLIVGVALWRSGVWERRVIREELADEVGRAVTPDEYRDIVNDGIFRTRRIETLRPNRSAALINAQHELAFSKHRARRAGRNPGDDAIVLGWRTDIGRLRESLN